MLKRFINILLLFTIPGLLYPGNPPDKLELEKVPVYIKKTQEYFSWETGKYFWDKEKKKYDILIKFDSSSIYKATSKRSTAFNHINVNTKRTESIKLKDWVIPATIGGIIVGILWANSLGPSEMDYQDYDCDWNYDNCEWVWNDKAGYKSALTRSRIFWSFYWSFWFPGYAMIQKSQYEKTGNISYASSWNEVNIFDYEMKINGSSGERKKSFQDIYLEKEKKYFDDFDLSSRIESLLKSADSKTVKLHTLVNQYNNINYTTNIVHGGDYKVHLLDKKKAKGEFETTLEYEKRMKQEGIERQTIKAEQAQQVKQAENEEVLARLDLLDKIEKLSKEIVQYKDLEYTLSDYDADRQEYTFTITENFYKTITKHLYVPLSEAPSFKRELDNLTVSQIYKPNMDEVWTSSPGLIKWKQDGDRIVLTKKDNREILPWIDEAPNIAQALTGEAPEVSVSVNFLEPSGEGFLDANETAELKVTLTNSGKGSALKNRISLKQESGSTLYYDVSGIIDEVKPNTSQSASFEVKVPESIKDSKAVFKLTFLESQGYEPDPVEVKVDTRALQPPDLQMVDYGISDQNGDGKITLGENVEMTVRIQNKGQGIAKGVEVLIGDDKQNNLFLAPYSEIKHNLGTILPGKAEDITFSLITNKRTEDITTVSLDIVESRSEFNTDSKIKIELDKTHTQMQSLSFAGVQKDVDIQNLSTLTIDVEKNIPKGSATNKDAVAIVIGNRDYSGDVPKVDFALRDAEYMKEYLIKTLGYRKGNIIHTENATLSQIKTAVKKLSNIAKKNQSDVFVYYSGHGAPDPKTNTSYLVPVDCNPNYVQTGGFALADLYSTLNEIEAKSTTVVIDACFSGSSAAGMLISNVSPIYIKVDDEALRTDNYAVYTSATGQQISAWYPDKKHSLFTYYFLKALQGDGDSNNDKKLTRGEIQTYLTDNVEYRARTFNREQSPQMLTTDKNQVVVRY